MSIVIVHFQQLNNVWMFQSAHVLNLALKHLQLMCVAKGFFIDNFNSNFLLIVLPSSFSNY